MRRKQPMRKRRTRPAGPASGVFLYLKFIFNLSDYKNYWNFRKERLETIVSQMEQSAKKQELAELLDQINEQLASL